MIYLNTKSRTRTSQGLIAYLRTRTWTSCFVLFFLFDGTFTEVWVLFSSNCLTIAPPMSSSYFLFKQTAYYVHGYALAAELQSWMKRALQSSLPLLTYYVLAGTPQTHPTDTLSSPLKLRATAIPTASRRTRFHCVNFLYKGAPLGAQWDNLISPVDTKSPTPLHTFLSLPCIDFAFRQRVRSLTHLCCDQSDSPAIATDFMQRYERKV